MLLSTHDAWYQMQRYKDRFEGLLSIDRLKQARTKARPVTAAAADQPALPPQTGQLASRLKHQIEHNADTTAYAYI